MGELVDDAGAMVRGARERAGITQAQLALRAGTSQAAISRIERGGGPSPSIATIERLLLVMGMRLELRAVPGVNEELDMAEIRRLRALPMEERLELAFAWNAFATEIAGSARSPEGDA